MRVTTLEDDEVAFGMGWENCNEPTTNRQWQPFQWQAGRHADLQVVAEVRRGVEQCSTHRPRVESWGECLVHLQMQSWVPWPQHNDGLIASSWRSEVLPAVSDSGRAGACTSGRAELPLQNNLLGVSARGRLWPVPCLLLYVQCRYLEAQGT